MRPHEPPSLLDVRAGLEALVPGPASGAEGALGLREAEVAHLAQAMFPGRPFASLAALERFARPCWRGAEVPEERLFVLAVLGLKGVQPVLGPEALPLLEALILDGPTTRWVDALGKERVGALYAGGGQVLRRTVHRWARSPSPWLRRAALVSQLGRGGRVDAPAVLDCVAPCLRAPEPVVQEAVRWALHELARWEPRLVRQFLADHRPALSRAVKQGAERGLRRARTTRRRR